jgi:NAD+ synthase
MYQMSSMYSTMFHGCIAGGVEYLKNNPKIEAMVIGLSGGLDSTVTAALARKVADKAGIRLIGTCMPIVSNTPEETARANWAGIAFCHEFSTKQMHVEWETIATSFEPMAMANKALGKDITFEEKVRLGNIKARLRMAYLYGQAAKANGIVLSTDNLTELMLGFWTLHGDVGDFGLIQELWKTEVYGLAEWLVKNVYTDGDELNALAAVLEAKPTDGLGVSNSDLDQLLPGVEYADWREGYRMVDNILIDQLTKTMACDPNHPVIQRHLNTKCKRDNPVSLKRPYILWQWNAI